MSTQLTQPSIHTLPAAPLSQTVQASALEAAAESPAYKNMTNSELADHLLTFNKALDAYGNTHFNSAALSQLAKGTQNDGRPASPAQKELARELLTRHDLLSELDLYPNGGVEDGKINWDAVAVKANKQAHLSDRGLMREALKYHAEFDSTGNGYVNVNELEQAAGRIPSHRQFSEAAKGVAQALLERPALLKQLDIGVNFLGLAGKEDNRYDITNLNHLINNSSDAPKPPFRGKTDW